MSLLVRQYFSTAELTGLEDFRQLDFSQILSFGFGMACSLTLICLTELCFRELGVIAIQKIESTKSQGGENALML